MSDVRFQILETLDPQTTRDEDHRSSSTYDQNEKLKWINNFRYQIARTHRSGPYRPLACVGVVRILYLKVYDFPHTRRHFVGQWNSSNVHVDPLLAPYQQYRRLDRLVAHVCYKANSDVCHTAAILDAAHRSVQQPAHNLVAV